MPLSRGVDREGQFRFPVIDLSWSLSEYPYIVNRSDGPCAAHPAKRRIPPPFPSASKRSVFGTLTTDSAIYNLYIR